jgi:hypothetical protein
MMGFLSRTRREIVVGRGARVCFSARVACPLAFGIVGAGHAGPRPHFLSTRPPAADQAHIMPVQMLRFKGAAHAPE